ncbi:hypothetical protein FVE85_7821 [Porphyridium purpureum]|uniref:Uncharacterized protein n=1 Tax=Porphyridium purpureum TaxID=35688 RepID=A0A5J4YKH2_PORPP|nr:hypothetical protein FVE85_7821 [Porphyridium purpureum]|eukprot:POR4602..scf210_14
MACIVVERERIRGLAPDSVAAAHVGRKDIWTEGRALYPDWFTAKKNPRTKVAMQAHMREHAQMVD